MAYSFKILLASSRLRTYVTSSRWIAWKSPRLIQQWSSPASSSIWVGSAWVDKNKLVGCGIWWSSKRRVIFSRVQFSMPYPELITICPLFSSSCSLWIDFQSRTILKIAFSFKSCNNKSDSMYSLTLQPNFPKCSAVRLKIAASFPIWLGENWFPRRIPAIVISSMLF